MAYHPKTLKWLSLVQIVTAAISILLGIASAAVRSNYTSYVGFGIWVGLWILATGLLGYFGSRDPTTPNKCLLGTFMGFAITVCVFCAVMFINYCVALGILNEALKCHKARMGDYNHFIHDRWRYDCHGTSYSGAKAGIGIGSILLIISIVEFFVALTSSIYCCNAVCGAKATVQTNQQVVFHQQHIQQVAGPGGMIIAQPSGPVGGSGGVVITQPSAGGVIFAPGAPMVQYPMQVTTIHHPPQPELNEPATNYQVPGSIYAPPYTTNAMVMSQPPPYSAVAGTTAVTIQHS